MTAKIADTPRDGWSAGGWPDVDVIMPVRNEAAHLRTAVDAVLAPDYPGDVRLTLAVGPSDDDTELIAARLAGDDDRVLVVDNPRRAGPRR
jgi:glycosyltransferase involved in cell wall biosynthesis